MRTAAKMDLNEMEIEAALPRRIFKRATASFGLPLVPLNHILMHGSLSLVYFHE